MKELELLNNFKINNSEKRCKYTSTGKNYNLNLEEANTISNEYLCKNLSMFVCISKFDYEGMEKGANIYSSVFYHYGNPKMSREIEDVHFESFIGRMTSFPLNDCLILDIGENKFNNILKETEQNVEGNKLLIGKTTYERFFDEEVLNKLSEASQEESKTIILHFNNKNWATIKSMFKACNINIGGNNNTLKHVLSPTQLKLSHFLLLLFGNDTKYVNNSFSNIARNKAVTRAMWDFSQKDDKDYLRKTYNLPYKGINKEWIDEFSNDNSEKRKINRLDGSFTQKRGIHSVSKAKSKQISQTKENSNLSLTSSSEKNMENSNLLLYFEGVKNIVNDNTLNSIEKQKIIENFIEKYVDQQVEEYDFESQKGQLLNLSSSDIRGVIYNALETFLIHSKKNKNKDFHINFLSTEDKEKMGLKCLIIAYGIIINYYNRLGYTAIAAQIGKIIMENNFTKEKREENMKLTNKVNELSFKEYLDFKNINEVDLIRLGDYFITILSQFPHDIFSRNFSKSNITNKEVAVIEINKEYLEKIRENLVISPSNLPMLAEPVKWSNKSYGGYLNNKIIKNEIITKNSDNKHEIRNKTKLYEAVNILNSTKFGINSLLLNYLKNEGSYILNTDQIKDEIQKEITLKLADILSNSPFYLTVRSDWRGRLVTESFFLSYQGSDLSKSLIEFWDGESLTKEGLSDFYIHGANCHNIENLSKKSLKERKDWVEENKEKIINLDRNLILTAENIFSFATFCLNMKEIEKNPKWKVKTPIFLDATCSGIQHFAGLLRDVGLAMQVNLTKSSIKDTPADVYSYLLDPINKAINDYGEENSLYSHFKLIKLNRKLIKQPIMTKLYNVTEYGISNQLQDKLESIKYNKDTQNEMIFKDLKENLKITNGTFFIVDGHQGNVLLTYSDLMQIAKIINDNIFIVFPSLKGIYDYFIGVVKILSEFNLPLWWNTPCGMQITQHYLKVKENKTQFNVFNQAKKLVLREKMDELSKARQTQGVIPNVIHSLDATHLIKVICSSKKEGFYPIIAIHDCFGTHPNKMKKLETNVKMEFISLYGRENYLKSFHKNIVNNLRTNNFKVKYEKKHYYVYSDIKEEWIQLPNYPKLGKFDLNQVKQSKYMIT